ncbi:hypothetical protein ACP4OV_020934 [Aristida adscensionis]
MDDTPIAKRFNMLCNSFYEVAEVGAMSDQSCNALIEAIHTLKIQFSSNSDFGSTEELHDTQEDSRCDGKSKTILSPIAVRSRGCPPTVRKESKGQSKATKRCTVSSSVPDQVNDISHIFPQDDVGHSVRSLCLNGSEHCSTIQVRCLNGPEHCRSNLSIHVANFNQHMLADVNSGQSPSLGVPLIHGEFTSLLLGVQQSAVAVPTPGEVLYDEWHTNPLHEG